MATASRADVQPKLIYISFVRLTTKIARDWYIDYSIEKGVAVEYWDIVPLVREKHNEINELDVQYLRQIFTYEQFENLLCQPENYNAVYVMLISYSGRTRKPFRILSKYNCKMVFLNWGAMPTVKFFFSRWQNTFFKLISNPFRLFKSAIDIIIGVSYRKLNLVHKYEIVFTAGTILSSAYQHSKRIIPLNLCDYDHYIRVKFNTNRSIYGRYAVFLDINLPFQSDLQYFGLNPVNPVKYFASLNRFFSLLENSFGIKVVVAAHPKASYISSEFKDREVHTLVTAELVKDSEFVITHTSTSMSYAILNMKPILFVYDDEMVRLYKDTVVKEIDSLASYLNLKAYHIDRLDSCDQISISTPNQELYELYKYNYLTSRSSENKISAEIFWHEISGIWDQRKFSTFDTEVLK